MSQPANKLKIAYVGVGLMGLPMTRRLVELGYAITAFDISPAQLALHHAGGCRRAA